MSKKLLFAFLFFAISLQSTIYSMNESFSNKDIIDDSHIYSDESGYAEQMLKDMGFSVPPGMSASTALELVLDGMPPEEIFSPAQNSSYESNGSFYDQSANSPILPANIADIEISNVDEFLAKFKSVEAGAFRHYGKKFKSPICSLKNFRDMHEILISLISYGLESACYFQKPFPIIPTPELYALYEKIYQLLKLYPEQTFFDQNFYEFAQLSFQIFETQATTIQDIKANIRVAQNLEQDVRDTVKLCDIMLKTEYLCYTILTKDNIERPLHRPAAAHLADVVTQSTHIFLSIFDRYNEIDIDLKMSIKQNLAQLMEPIAHRDSIACLMNLEELIINFSATIKEIAQLIASSDAIVHNDNSL